MPRFLTLIGIICGLAGVGLLIVLLLALINNQVPTGAFLATAPFFLIAIATFILTRQKM